MQTATKQQRTTYPFAALVGQEDLQLGLLLHAVNPRLGGMLIRGEKGTAKSTAVRGLAELLPVMETVQGCPYHCDPRESGTACEECRTAGSSRKISVMPVPVVELPVSATEDRVVGSLDFEQTMKTGRRAFTPGLMGEANRGIIYVDEINLLDDHIVDVLLDAAGSGINVVEREGISVTHPAGFILVGTMNPEEGDIRPQLLDRFALCADITGEADPHARVKIIKRRETFDLAPADFLAEWRTKQQELREKIAAAKKKLPQVVVADTVYEYIGDLCMKACVAGHRADVVLLRAAVTLAAWRGHGRVTPGDVADIAPMVLAHRRRQPPQPEQQAPEPPPDAGEPPTEQDEQQQAPERRPDNRPEAGPAGEAPGQQAEADKQAGGSQPVKEVVYAIGTPFAVKRVAPDRDRLVRRGSGRRSRTRTDSRAGRYVKSTCRRERNDLALDATIRAAAPFQRRRRQNGRALVIEKGDIREKEREKRIGNFILFVVDASGSMGARQRMVETKGAILSLLLDAYQKRDRVAMIAFRGTQAELLLPPTNSVELAQKSLSELPVGGKTPLTAGLVKAMEVIRQQLKRSPHMRPILILLSDGKATAAMAGGSPLAEARLTAASIREELDIACLVVDTEKKDLLSLGIAQELAAIMGAKCCTIDQLKTDSLAGLVRAQLAT
ncbi:MAG TPA: putative cobaltochelatase [Methylomusa anaerophila]|uniref:Mg-protoporphyrin IX chelatase n=1 Tax=Methylomusa anaerophila TaxID=1930071 RepID=A0A348AL90_9FIRM|nr:putative cobaltochelatase [Methylomusa anaerophila]BBB91838.1 magnesium-chelatase 38 kDa subunit [Methylomusa anaerophila]HML88429.1 putative cobaltochelatase [Methylomusa anaerophila]